MATMNPFDLLGDDDTDDLSQLIAAQKVAAAAAPKQQHSVAAGQAKQQPAAQAKLAKQLPSKPAHTGREEKNEAGRGGGRSGGGGGRGYGRGRGAGGYRRDENSFSNSGFSTGQGAPEDGESGKTSERRGGFGGSRGPYQGGGGRRGGFSNGDVDEGERPRRAFERRSGTGRGNELKREGSGRGNWGSQNDEFSQATEEVKESEKNLGDEKPAGDRDTADVDKESPTKEPEEKEPEDKEMTLEEYQKVLEEKRKALQVLKTEERKVDVKEFETMQQLSNKKGNNDVFIKLGSDKDKRKEAAEKEEKAKKAVNITEFLKPAEGERYHNSGGRGRGRGGRGSRGGYVGGSTIRNVPAPSIEDPGQFPTLGAK